jgi:hypothetical protein
MLQLVMIIGCYLLCRLIKPMWKAFFVGLFVYIGISFLVMIASVVPGTQLNVTGSSLFYFFGGEAAKFFSYFLFGGIIYILTSIKIKKTRNLHSEVATDSDSNVDISTD